MSSPSYYITKYNNVTQTVYETNSIIAIPTTITNTIQPTSMTEISILITYTPTASGVTVQGEGVSQLQLILVIAVACLLILCILLTCALIILLAAKCVKKRHHHYDGDGADKTNDKEGKRKPSSHYIEKEIEKDTNPQTGNTVV